jgi:hypothetical protein
VAFTGHCYYIRSELSTEERIETRSFPLARPLEVIPGHGTTCSNRVSGSGVPCDLPRQQSQTIYGDDRDPRRYLEKLSLYCQEKKVDLLASCLMSNHVHLLWATPKGNLSKMMQAFQTSYTVYFNKRHGRSGYPLKPNLASELAGSRISEKSALGVKLTPADRATYSSQP